MSARPKPSGRTALFTMRVSVEERARWQAVAEQHGLSLAGLVRYLFAYAVRDLPAPKRRRRPTDDDGT